MDIAKTTDNDMEEQKDGERRGKGIEWIGTHSVPTGLDFDSGSSGEELRASSSAGEERE